MIPPDDEYPVRYSLPEYFSAIEGCFEAFLEHLCEEHADEDIESGIDKSGIDKRFFQHLVIDALDMMCDCGHCDDLDPEEKADDVAIAMVSLFGNTEDVKLELSDDPPGSFTYTATHTSGKTTTLHCPPEECTEDNTHQFYFIKAMEQLKELL